MHQNLFPVFTSNHKKVQRFHIIGFRNAPHSTESTNPQCSPSLQTHQKADATKLQLQQTLKNYQSLKQEMEESQPNS
jgi:hypothetical protein